MTLATLFGRLITSAQRISINFFLTQQLFISMSLIILIIASPSLPVVSSIFFGTHSALTQPICRLAQRSFSTDSVMYASHRYEIMS